ncbi:hypothetical protein GCM10022252_76330 [Streptosporangium oxazolinicum]|uniref:Uncharacterized protein n=1 Tax=Streptosporangium oxazolinicum TaxID=909287 RepID=A0ABP8BLA8_9ACTN
MPPLAPISPPYPPVAPPVSYVVPLIPTPLLTEFDTPGHCEDCGRHEPPVDDYDKTLCCGARICLGADCQHIATCRTCDGPAVEFIEGTGWVCANTGH